MMSRIMSCAFSGVDTFRLSVETDVSRGLPAFTLVGLPDTAVRESRERVRAAIINSGHEFPARRITVNLAPADIPKIGSGYDLPIAIGILASSGHGLKHRFAGVMAAGELALDGTLRPVRGALPMALEAIQCGAKALILPLENAKQLPRLGNLRVFGVCSLNDALGLDPEAGQTTENHEKAESCRQQAFSGDFCEISGQKKLKRAMEIAAAGGHNILVIGPPGSGKTMICQRFISIMPDLEPEQSLAVTKIYSIAGLISEGSGLIEKPPFRAPHHSGTVASMIGGGRPPKPGEATLAHFGVLFLDELAHFHPAVTDSLRQAVSESRIHISRGGYSVTMPADFLLLGAMNPCRCGYFGDSQRTCSCGRESAVRYMTSALSGPLADRFGLQILLRGKDMVTMDEQVNGAGGETSLEVKKRVLSARSRQIGRQRKLNGKMQRIEIIRKRMNDEAMKVFRDRNLFGIYSARAMNHAAWTAMTIADLEGREVITGDDMYEATMYRSYDRLVSSGN